MFGLSLDEAVAEWVDERGLEEGDVVAHDDNENVVRLGQWLEPGGWSLVSEMPLTVPDMMAICRLMGSRADARSFREGAQGWVLGEPARDDG